MIEVNFTSGLLLTIAKDTLEIDGTLRKVSRNFRSYLKKFVLQSTNCSVCQSLVI